MQPERQRLAETYKGRWQSILTALGVPAQMLVNRHGPCPVCGGRDRFRFDDKDGLGTFFCTHCGAGDGPRLAMLFTGLGFKETAERIRSIGGDRRSDQTANIAVRPDALPREELPEAKRARMNALWGKALPVREHDPAGVYLTSRLGHMPERTGLRFQPRCPYPEGDTWPAMLGIFVGVDGIPSGLHRTYLSSDGRKAPVVSAKLSLGPLIDGGAVRLSPVAPVLGIAEGIETALAASVLFGVPCWAALNANRLAVWEPPEGVREVVIYADNDDSFTGQTAAFDLEARLRDRLSVRIEIPVREDADWNDILLERRRRGRAAA